MLLRRGSTLGAGGLLRAGDVLGRRAFGLRLAAEIAADGTGTLATLSAPTGYSWPSASQNAELVTSGYSDVTMAIDGTSGTPGALTEVDDLSAAYMALLAGNRVTGRMSVTLLRPLGLSGEFDYYIDADSGDDGNAGTSEGAAWASLSKIEGVTGSAGTKTRVLVKHGTYDTANDHFEINGFAGELEVVFEPNCIMDGTVHGTTAQNPIYAGNSATVMTIYGNGLTVQNYSGSTGGSPNGLGYGGSGTILTAYNVTVDNAQDGVSGHTTGHAEIWDCTFKNCQKYQCANVDSSTINAYRSVFEASSSGDFASNGDGLQYFKDCKFVDPAGSGNNRFLGDNMQFETCQIGDGTYPVDIAPNGVNSAIAILVEDSFVHVDIQAWDNITYRRCFGYMHARQRDGAGVFTVENSIITGGSPGGASVFYDNFDTGGSNRHLISNNIFAGSFDITAYRAAVAGYVVASSGQYHNNVAYDGASYGANLQAADDGSVITGTITSDPLIGSADSLDPDDYGFTTGSPAEDAATDGGDVGFAVGAVDARAAQQDVPQVSATVNVTVTGAAA